jgi:tetratricopeptide (TPR) repeat protein
LITNHLFNYSFGWRLVYFTALAWLFPLHGVFAQQNAPDSLFKKSETAKTDFLAEARKMKDLLQFENAVDYYSHFLEGNNGNYEAFIERAYCNEKLNRYEEAINDYKSALNLKPGEIDLYRKALIDYLQIENYTQATEMFATMVVIKNKTVDAYQKVAQSKIKLGDYDGAIKEINTAIDYDNTNDYSHFLKGVAMDSLGNLQVAIQSYLKAISSMYLSKDYKEAKDRNPYKPYFINLSIAQRRLGHYEESIKNLNTAITYDAEDANIYCERGLTYLQKGDINNSLIDLNKAISIDNKNAKCYFSRGLYYEKNQQYQNAIGDFTNAVLFDPGLKLAYFERGKCYEALNKYEEAISEYKLAKENNLDKKIVEKAIAGAKEKEYEYKKEQNLPKIIVANADSSKGAISSSTIKIPKDRTSGVIKGSVIDQSAIKSITIDGVEASFSPDQNNPSFSATVPIINKEKLVVQVTDIYFNTSTQTYEIERTENKQPTFVLLSPFITLDNEIFPENNNITTLYVEGKAEDESAITGVMINGVKASFNQGNTSVNFSLNIDIATKDSLIIEISDIFGNTARTAYFINRLAANETAQNPMGRTWVIFIENSDYQNLPSLEGTKKDVILMKAALANYSIHKVIHKVNMKKNEMDRFFSIELRDQVNKGQVQSLVIWFAGHGKFINETGYWLPVDAAKLDEYTYFPITSLKGYLSLYKLRHTLVVSDACETGPAFYLAMRGEPKTVDCNSWELTRLKSAQVLTSSDKEKSSDNSIFTKTFANILNNNPDRCIPIEKISEKVIPVVEQNQKQKPKFGYISGLEDENGTFFFIKK